MLTVFVSEVHDTTAFYARQEKLARIPAKTWQDTG